MRRKIINAKSPLVVNLSDIILGKRIEYDENIHYQIIINDDCPNARFSDLNILNYYHQQYGIQSISNLSLYHHELLLKSWNRENGKINISFGKGARLRRIFNVYDPEIESLNIGKLLPQRIFEIDPKDRYKIDKLARPALQVNYHPELMASTEFLAAIDNIAMQISRLARNNIDKIILLNKFIKDNIKYDFFCYHESQKFNRDHNYRITDSDINGIHNGHHVQAVISRKNAVCSAIATFAELVLSHPLLNIKCIRVQNERVIPDHCWNNVYIDGKWYTCDFTWTIFYNHPDQLKYILIKSRCPNSEDENYCLEYSNQDYNRQILNSSLSYFMNSFITIPAPITRRRHLPAANANTINEGPILRRRRITTKIDNDN